MARLECLTCHGVYETAAPDGARYFHVCPPLTRRELQAEVTAGRIQLRAGETVDQAYLRRVYPRPNARDETVWRHQDPASPGAIKAEGLGVRVVRDEG